MSPMKYSFNRKEMNNWKARITERLIECYIEDVLIPSLKRESWDIVIYSTATWFSVPDSEGFNPDFRNEKIFFLSNGLLPTSKLLKHFEKLTSALENCPDGFLIKLRKTGESKKLKDGMVELGLKFYKGYGYSYGRLETSETELHRTHAIASLKERGYAIVKSLHFTTDEHDKDELFPIVDGEVEVAEVKSDKATLPPHQKRSYGNILREGYVLHFFHVNIVSFEKNEFEIEEKLLTNPNELRTFSLKKQKFS